MLQTLFDQRALLFTLPALLGTAAFLVRLGLMVIGGIGDADVDTGLDVDADLGDTDATDSTDAFNLLSVQSVAAFLMGFGWGGFGALVGFGWGLPRSLLVALGFGAFLVWMLGLLMKAMYDLQSSGNIDIEDAVGVAGAVYANVPAAGEGRGQVRVVITDRARIYNAISDGGPLATGTTVRVVKTNDDRTLTVTAV